MKEACDRLDSLGVAGRDISALAAALLDIDDGLREILALVEQAAADQDAAAILAAQQEARSHLGGHLRSMASSLGRIASRLDVLGATVPPVDDPGSR